MTFYKNNHRTLTIMVCLIGMSSWAKTQHAPMARSPHDVPALNLENMDTSTSPQEDIYRFVNGAWLDRATIPDDRVYWGVGPELDKNAQDDLLQVLQLSAANNTYSEGSDQYKAILLYESYLDTIARNALGVEPVKPYLAKIEAITDFADLQNVIREFVPTGLPLFFGYGVGPDRKNSAMNRVYLGTGTRGLPERDYYLLEDEESAAIREKYIAFMIDLLSYLGYSNTRATQCAHDAMRVETEMARLMLSKEDRRDARKTYHPMPLRAVRELTPSIDWVAYMEDTHFGWEDTVAVTQPEYFKGIEKMFQTYDLEVLKNYLIWSMANATNKVLTTELERMNWEFYAKELAGSKKQRPIQERGLALVSASLGEALGKVYVDRKFPPEAKAAAKELVDNIIEAFHLRINYLRWMSAETKEKAIEKLEKLTVKIGYPDHWFDYSGIQLKSKDEGGNLFDHMFALARWSHDYSMSEVGQPVDKERWLMNPQDVNAYYYPPNNEIVFPAAILQPPYFNYTADDAVNYGAIGGIIGHEISHAFDDSGARYDADGNLNNWWTEEDLEKFTVKGNQLADQYSRMEVLPGVFVNGEFTLGENIGDLGGIHSAYDALQIKLRKTGDPGLIDGFTQNERFFLSWSACWRRLMTDEFRKQLIKTDPHAPARFRVLLPLQNMDAFHDTFRTKPGDGMYLAPEKRIKVW